MSTIGYESWAHDLAEVGAIYPFQGYEGLMLTLGLIFWIGWHVLQALAEKTEFEEEMQKLAEIRRKSSDG